MSAELQYPFADIPEPVTKMEVAPGVYWLRMPLPFALDHINLWLLDDGDGWTLVDTGLGNDKTKALWQRAFDEVLDGRPIKRLVVTHFHPDHMGLSGWLCGRWDIPLTATLTEWLFARMLSVDLDPAFTEAQVAFYRRAGFDEALLAAVAERGNIYATRVDTIPLWVRRIQGGDEIFIGGRGWRVMIGSGHAAEHACLYCQELGVLISGDQILPRITPIVGVWPQDPEANPLKLFLASLEQFRHLPAETLVLPSHGKPFRGLRERLSQIDAHHEKRLAETLEACAQPVTGADLLRALFTRPNLDMHQMVFALSESLAHAHYLMAQGTVVREEDSRGVWLYRRR